MKFFQGTRLVDILPFIKWIGIGIAAWWLFGKIIGFFTSPSDEVYNDELKKLKLQGLADADAKRIAANWTSEGKRATIILNLPFIGPWLSSYLFAQSAKNESEAIAATKANYASQLNDYTKNYIKTLTELSN